jgi:DNA-binding IclR family transcriptional regulator
MTTTQNEEMVLKVIEDCMNAYGDGFSDIMVEDIVAETGLDVRTVKGLLGSLVRKDLVYYMDVNGEYNVYYSSRVEF